MTISSGMLTARVVALVVGLASVAHAAPAFAQDAPGGLDLQAIVTGLLGSVNVPVLTMLTVLAFAFHRTARITAVQAVTWPIAAGAALGALSALASAQQRAGGWLMVPALAQAVIEGAIVNGGMAVVVGRLASVGLERLWPSTPPSTPNGGE